ncbi:MAG: carbohydrate kinase [Actinomycetota bacterium]|nr:carbohydrate kinase [Actinomycetota bacterium]
MILVSGEALVDLVVGPEGSIVAHTGGAAFNVCRTIARLERPAAFFGALSDDRFGAVLRRALESEGVDLSRALSVHQPSTLALADVNESGAATYRFYTEGTSTPAVPGAASSAALALAPSALYVGTLGLVLEPLATAVKALVDGVADDVLVMLDPNCRPSATPDRAKYLATVAHCAHRADVIKVSEEDLEFLDPGSDAVTAARSLMRPQAVALLTRGAAGVTILTPDRAIEIAAPHVTVVDTVGAGDGLVGAFLAFWDMHGLGPRDVQDLDRVVDAVSFGVQVAALICERPGADPPRLVEIEARVALGSKGS